jgi:hypothetical protein
MKISNIKFCENQVGLNADMRSQTDFIFKQELRVFQVQAIGLCNVYTVVDKFFVQ